ncbi:MAG: hypothetical protein ACAI35_03315 [Candidatus Methylacidiphilales bacterium]|nr:hypothetical protein [Candidatus Methylacidiphilales bacterium]
MRPVISATLALLLALIALVGMRPDSVRGENRQRVFHVLVALCDNEHQGILKVPVKIGNGDDADANLYWGCNEGIRSFFRRSASWKLVKRIPSPEPDILERVVFRHKTQRDVWLVADAYRGSKIRLCTERFLKAASGAGAETLLIEQDVAASAAPAASLTPDAKKYKLGERPALPALSPENSIELTIGGDAELIAYIGHNGLMDFTIEPSSLPVAVAGNKKPVILLCCAATGYFSEPLRIAGAWPVLWTTDLMCPEAYTLEAALDGWLARKSPSAIADMAAAAYNKYQKCGFKPARRLLVNGSAP